MIYNLYLIEGMIYRKYKNSCPERGSYPDNQI